MDGLTPIGRSTSQGGGRRRWSEYEIYRIGVGWYLRIWGRSTVPGEVDILTEHAALTRDEVLAACTSPGGWLTDTAMDAIQQAARTDHELAPYR